MTDRKGPRARLAADPRERVGDDHPLVARGGRHVAVLAMLPADGGKVPADGAVRPARPRQHREPGRHGLGTRRKRFEPVFIAPAFELAPVARVGADGVGRLGLPTIRTGSPDLARQQRRQRGRGCRCWLVHSLPNRLGDIFVRPKRHFPPSPLVSPRFSGAVSIVREAALSDKLSSRALSMLGISVDLRSDRVVQKK